MNSPSSPSAKLPLLWLDDLRLQAESQRTWLWQGYVAPGNVTLTITAPGYQTSTFSAVADAGVRTNVGVLTLLNGDNNPPSPPV